MPFLTVDGVKLHYEVQGSGTPILFVHPPLLNSVAFTCQVKALSDQFQTITFDIRGHGHSEPSREPVTYERIAKDMHAIVDALQLDTVIVCGYSTGGSVCLEFLLQFPAQALGAVVISGMSEVSDLRLKTRLVIGGTLMKLNAVKLLALSLVRAHFQGKQMTRKAYSIVKRGHAANVLDYYTSSRHYNCSGRLAEIFQPVALVYGKKDKPFLRYAKLLHNHLPNNELFILPNVGHQIPVRAASDLNAIVSEFTRRCESMVQNPATRN